MKTSKRASFENSYAESSVFLDGDTLVVVFSPEPDFSHCANLILYTAKQAEAHNMQHLLLDCSELIVPLSPAFKHVTDVGRFLSHRNTRVLVLDASEEFKTQIQPLLPDALWIASCTGSMKRAADKDEGIPVPKHPFTRSH